MKGLAAVLHLLVLIVIAGEVNHLLAPLQVHLYVGGLVAARAALRLEPRTSLLAVILAGLWMDSTAPVPFGLQAFLFVGACLVIRHLREKRGSDEFTSPLPVVLALNALLFLALCLAGGAGPSVGATWMRALSDLIISQLVVAVVTPWFLSLQERTLKLAADRGAV
jgi:cell shape-determining protein MreD